MMAGVIAYLLCMCRKNSEHEAVRKIMKIGCVEEAYITYGEVDLIVKVVCDTMQELDNVVINKVRKIPGIESTRTLIAVTS